MSNSNISYFGRVRITNNDGLDITLNNQGTEALGKVITKALAGYNINDEIPKYFNIETYDSNGECEQKLLNRNIPFTGITYKTDNFETNVIGQLQLNCIILYQDKSRDNANSQNVRFCIYNSKNEVLAKVSTESITTGNGDGDIVQTNTDTTSLSAVYDGITMDTDCLITWTMQFLISNQSEV